MATVTLTKSTSGKSFTITNTPGGTTSVYPVGTAIMTTTGNVVQLTNRYTGIPIMNRLYSDVINGDTSSAFADLASLQAYVLANCY